jgi:hypothetical protein
VHEQKGKTLALRERRQCRRQARLNVRELVVERFGKDHATTDSRMTTRRALPNSVEIAGWVLHVRQPVAVLPGVRHYIAPYLDATLPAVAGNEDLPQALLRVDGETIAAVNVFAPTILGCLHTFRDPRTSRLRHRDPHIA